MNRPMRWMLAVGLAASWSGLPAARAEVASCDRFGLLPVLANGRVMPMDSFARNTLLRLSGKSRFQRTLPASSWLARVLFTPEATRNDEVFLVNNPEVLEGLGIPGEGRRRVSLDALQPVLSRLDEQAAAAWRIPPEARSPVEEELVRLYLAVGEYISLVSAFSFALPGADGAAPGQPSGHGPRMIPPPAPDDGDWLTPWEVAAAAPPAPGGELAALTDLARAFRAGDQDRFDRAADAILSAVATRAGPTVDPASLAREVRFNRSRAFYRAEMAYGLAFLAVLAAILFRTRWIDRAALGLVLLGLLPHSYGLAARMQIMGRPPVTNLYSTFVFVAWASVVLGLILEAFRRNRLGLLSAAMAGLTLLLVSGRFAADGDTMGVMVAVLDSNFWLATHVVTISLGYAGCGVAGLIGHVYLLRALRRPPEDPVLHDTFDSLYGALAFGMVFSFLGTMLGGIWADQSWGRFWGWDPKENGALVIVLWCAILFHARIARMIGPRGFAAGSIIGVVWVLLAWLGVNLLSVGLHTYGFTSNLAWGLLIACAVEIAFVIFVPPFAKAPASATEPPGDAGSRRIGG